MMRLVLQMLVLAACGHAVSSFAQNDARLVVGYGRAGWNGTNRAHNYSGKSSAGIVTTNFKHNADTGYYFANGAGIVSTGVISVNATLISSQTSWTAVAAFSSTNRMNSGYLWAESRQDGANMFLYGSVNGSNIFFSSRGMSGGSAYTTLRATNKVLDGVDRMIVWEHTGTTFNIFIDDVLCATTNSTAYPAAGITGATRQTVGFLERNDGGDGTDSFRGIYYFFETYTPALDPATRSQRFQQWRATKP